MGWWGVSRTLPADLCFGCGLLLVCVSPGVCGCLLSLGVCCALVRVGFSLFLVCRSSFVRLLLWSLVVFGCRLWSSWLSGFVIFLNM